MLTFVSTAPLYLIFLRTLVSAASYNINRSVYRRAAPTLQTASWIWTSDTTTGSAPVAPAETCAFRKTYITPSGDTARSATVLITVDNSFTLYLNGQLMGSSFNWMNGSLFEITNIDPHENVFAISATNWPLGGNPNSSAGLLANIEIKMDSGLEVNLVSDSSWRANTRLVNDFEMPSTDDSGEGWSSASAIGKYGPTSPWLSRVSVLPAVTVAYAATSTSSASSTSTIPAPSTVVSATVTSTSSGHSSPSNKPAIAAIVGGTVGGVALAAIVVLCIFCMRRRSRAHVTAMDLLDSPQGDKADGNQQPRGGRPPRIDPYFIHGEQATSESAGSQMLALSSNLNTHVISSNPRPRPLTLHQPQERENRGSKVNDSSSGRLSVLTSPPPEYSDA